MDDIKLFAKKEKELETLIQTVRISSQDIGMGIWHRKCAMLLMKSCKRQRTEGVQQPNQVGITTLGERQTYEYLGILKADTSKQKEVKEKDYLRRTRKLLETKLYTRKLVKGIIAGLSLS